MNMDLENRRLNELRAKYEEAKSSYFADLEKDANRVDGSARQDTLHERFMQESRDEYYDAKEAFEAQQQLVAKHLQDKTT